MFDIVAEAEDTDTRVRGAKPPSGFGFDGHSHAGWRSFGDAAHQRSVSRRAHRHDDDVDAPQDLFEALRSGAQGYLLKNLEMHQWTSYLRSIMDGATPISGSFAERILHELTGPGASDPGCMEPLTAREEDVLRLVADGLTNRDIASQLGISQNTVKNHIKNILAKLQADNRTQLVRLALERGLVD